MTSTVKRAVIGFCVAFGNMFLAHGLFLVFIYLIKGQDPEFYMLYSLQLAANIVLYFTVLKKQFEPVKERKPLFYFLLAVIAGAVWTGEYFIFMKLLELHFFELNMGDDANYPEVLFGFLPLLLMFTIVFSVIYYTLFRKRVGELFYFYTLSISLVATIPIAFIRAVVEAGP